MRRSPCRVKEDSDALRSPRPGLVGSLVPSTSGVAETPSAAPPTTDIKLSQVSYPTRASKLAFVVAKAPAPGFSVVRAADGAPVLTGWLAEPVRDADSGDRVQTADFSSLDQPGRYVLVVSGVGRSFEFAIGDDVNLYYLLGRNAFSLSWVTGVGANPFRHPHHRPSGADANAEPWPGLLSGGPNRRKQDPAMQKLPDGLPPATSTSRTPTRATRTRSTGTRRSSSCSRA